MKLKKKKKHSSNMQHGVNRTDNDDGDNDKDAYYHKYFRVKFQMWDRVRKRKTERNIKA